jgi:hypothetical protein
MFYERDGKSWDATMQDIHYELKYTAYSFMPREFIDFVAAGFKTRVRARVEGSLFKYKLQGTVKSGDNDTTLGNTIINSCIALEAMAALGLRGDIIVAGDDLLIVIDGDFDAVAFALVERQLGITPDYRKFADWESVSFISGGWWQSQPGDYFFAPKVGRLLARLWWSVNPPPRRRLLEFKSSVAMGLWPICKDLPVIRQLLEPHVKEGSKMGITGKYYALTAEAVVGVNPFLVRIQFCGKYSLTEAELVEVEDFVSSIATDVGLARHHLVDRILDADCADLASRPEYES